MNTQTNTGSNLTKIKFYQKSEQGETVSFSLEATIDNNKGKLIGSALNELFATVSESKAIGSKLFSYNAPILVKISGEGFLLDMGQAKREYQSKLKLQNNGKSKRRFAKRVLAIYEAMSREFKVFDINDLLASLPE